MFLFLKYKILDLKNLVYIICDNNLLYFIFEIYVWGNKEGISSRYGRLFNFFDFYLFEIKLES